MKWAVLASVGFFLQVPSPHPTSVPDPDGDRKCWVPPIKNLEKKPWLEGIFFKSLQIVVMFYAYTVFSRSHVHSTARRTGVNHNVITYRYLCYAFKTQNRSQLFCQLINTRSKPKRVFRHGYWKKMQFSYELNTFSHYFLPIFFLLLLLRISLESEKICRTWFPSFLLVPDMISVL